MNLWRCLGAFIFLLGVGFALTAAKLPVYAGGKDAKKDEKKAEEKKAEEKKAEEKKAEEKKAEEKKGEEKKAEAKKGEQLKFTAFEKKTPFFQELDTTTTQLMKVMGQQVEQTQKQTFVIQWAPQDKDAKGDYVVTQKIVGVKMNIDIGGNKIAYDSTDAKRPKNPMTDFFDQLLKQELKFTINPQTMEVKSIEGRKEFIAKLGETNPQMKTLLDTILSEEALRKMAEPTWWALPTENVEKGATWTKKSELNLGPIGTYNTTFDFTYAGPQEKEKLDKIDIKAAMTYAAPKDKQGLPFTITSASLSSKSGSGEALYSREKGRFESSKMNMKLAGTLTIDVGNMATEITLDQTQDSTTRTHDADPWAKK